MVMVCACVLETGTNARVSRAMKGRRRKADTILDLSLAIRFRSAGGGGKCFMAVGFWRDEANARTE